MFRNVGFIDPAVLEQQMLDTIQNRHVRPNSRRQMNRGFLGRVGDPRINDDELGRMRTGQAVEHPCP